jgi:predicted acetyltransferase/GrpB-like predicted nucleotidyltransferase (UPF0157 family)
MLDEPIQFQSYRDEWEAVFLAERTRLAAALDIPPVVIEHIGSTAVPGLGGKPIADIMIGADRIPPPDRWTDELRRAGYEAMGEAGIPGRWYFRLRTEPFRNVHVVEYRGPHWNDNLALRAYLRRTPAAASRYQTVKHEAVASGAVTLLAYSRAKRQVLADLLAEAAARDASGLPAARVSADAMRLVWPSREYLASYVAALRRGWTPDNTRGDAAASEELARIAADADAFLASLVDSDARGARITLPDGTTAPRLPGYSRWIWDGEFCGRIGLRWQHGTESLPPYCLGHIGYTVVPWKQRRGYATRALREILRDAAAEGLRYVEITTDPDNRASQRVILANGGVLVDEFVTPPALGAKRALRYRVSLTDSRVSRLAP